MTPARPLGCRKPRIAGRIIFEKLIQVLRFGCSYESIAGCACGATAIRERCDERIRQGTFAELKEIAREAYARSWASCWRSPASTGASPRRPAAASAPGAAPLTGGNPA
jgi:hypothetical protein